MLFAQTTHGLNTRFGVEGAVNMLADAGFPAVDIAMLSKVDPPFCDDWRGLAKRLKAIKAEKGITYVQAHAPTGGWQEYIDNVIPMLPNVFEFCGMLGIPNVVVHPIMRGYYYDDKERMYDENMKFYSSIAQMAKDNGVKIGIENMWQRHRVSGIIGDCILADPCELIRMYDELSDPEAFTVCLDMGHIALCGREPEDAVRVIGGERLGCIHAHDVDYKEDLHLLPGLSKINWDNVCRALGEVGYNGCFTLEATKGYANFEDAQIPTVLKFMAETTRYLADKVEFYKDK